MGASDPEVSRRSARELERELDELAEIAALPSLVPLMERRRDYKAFWAKVKAVNTLFKESRLSREDRERLWSRHQDLCNEVKRLQDQERSDREASSKNNRNAIWFELKNARPICEWANSVTELDQAEVHLAKAMEVLKDTSEFMLHDHRNECWTEWKELKGMAADRRERLWHLNYETMRGEIPAISSLACDDNPHEALREIKAFQQRIIESDLDRKRKQLLREEVQPWWDRAIARIEDRKEEARRKAEEWRERAEGRRDRMAEALERKEEFIERLEDQIDELEEQVSNARTEEFADRVRGWIEEKYEKIREVQAEIVELQEKIRDLDERLRE